MEQYGDYEIESFLGKGSIGKVFLARHKRIGRRVALKTVQLDQKFEDEQDQTEFHKRLQREAELCASMQHPNVVTLYDVGYAGDVVSWFATEYVDGESLLGRLKRTRPLPLDEALSIAADLLRGLAYAHSKGIIHRDIKPANILLTSTGQAKIADFGVARPLHSSLTATRSLVGTPNYMSPEQVKTTPVSTRSDLFSAGTVMYEMLTGVKPFGAPELSGILYNVVNLTPAPMENAPDALAKIVAKLMAKKPEDRYATADEALADLEAVRTARNGLDTIAVAPGDATTPLPTMLDEETRPLLRRPIHPAVFWVITLLLVSALTVTVAALRRGIAAQKPAAGLTTAQLKEWEAKERALATAEDLVEAGRFEDAIRAYDAHLARYPHSIVAQTARADAQKRLEEAMPKAEVTKVARRPKRETKEEEEPPKKKPGRWERFKRWFRGGD